MEKILNLLLVVISFLKSVVNGFDFLVGDVLDIGVVSNVVMVRIKYFILE